MEALKILLDLERKATLRLYLTKSLDKPQTSHKVTKPQRLDSGRDYDYVEGMAASDQRLNK